MLLSFYYSLMAFFERVKPLGDKRSRYKFIRAWNTVIYMLVSVLENILIKYIPLSAIDSRKIDKRCQFDKCITASLTTFPARINEVYYAVKSILFQTIPPQRTLLWLAESQFPTKQIPSNLGELCKYGLEIRFCDDLRSHKKYYYALLDQEEKELVITFDDDIIYHPHTIERLIEKHNEYPQNIICSQVHVMTFDENGNLNPYNLWALESDGLGQPNNRYMPLTGSGCLYPYNIMPKVAFDIDKIHSLAFSADDLWIGCTIIQDGQKICKTDKVSHTFSVVGDSQVETLSQLNCIGHGNDLVMEKLQSEFGLIRNEI